MTTAVIISTYNQPLWLEKVLWGYAAQTNSRFNVVIADDGSGAATRAVIERARNDFGSRLQHIWHEDRGFRKCEILNRAIVAADADYLIFTDGDCVPRADFVQTHSALAEAQRFLSGGVVWLPRSASNELGQTDIVSGAFAKPAWFSAHGLNGGRSRLRLVRNHTVASVLDRVTPTRPTFNGHNTSVWRSAVIEANGFDAEMGYGGLDRALGERLINLGYRGKSVRHRAVCFHLDHDRPYQKADVVQRNREIRARIRHSGEVRARVGITELTSATEDE